MSALIAALGAAQDALPPEEWRRIVIPEVAEVMGMLEDDMKRLAESAPDKANELFSALLTTTGKWTKSLALDALAEPLLRHYADDEEKRQAVIDGWVQLLDDDDELVRETARDTLSRTVYTAHVEGWLDEPTMQYIDSKLPPVWQRSNT